MNKQIEEQGLNLLKKGQKGLFHVVFSRVGLMVVLLVLQFMILFAGFAWFKEALPHIYGGSTIFAVAMVLYVLNRNHDPSANNLACYYYGFAGLRRSFLHIYSE